MTKTQPRELVVGCSCITAQVSLLRGDDIGMVVAAAIMVLAIATDPTVPLPGGLS